MGCTRCHAGCTQVHLDCAKAHPSRFDTKKGLVTRTEFTDSKVTRVEYALTDDGVALHPSLESVFEWVLHRSSNPRIQSLKTPCSTQVTTGSGGEV